MPFALPTSETSEGVVTGMIPGAPGRSRALSSLLLRRQRELARQLRDDGPFVSGRRPHEGDRERFLDGQGTRCRVHFVCPNDDRLTRTYVNSRRVVRTRVDVNRREFDAFRGFESRPHLKKKAFESGSWLRVVPRAWFLDPARPR